MKTINLLLISSLTIFISCSRSENFTEDFDRYHDRIWVSPDFWAIPMEDWKIQDGRIVAEGDHPERKLNLLTSIMEGEGSFHMKIRLGLTGNKEGYAGILFGLKDDTDNDPKSVSYFGKGTLAGFNTDGRLFIGDKSIALPESFDFTDLTLDLKVFRYEASSIVLLGCIDSKGKSASMDLEGFSDSEGMIALVCSGDYWFDDFSLEGTMVRKKSENAFGPILFSMYTLSKGSLKLTAQLPPLGEEDNQDLHLELLREGKWQHAGIASMQPDARIACFRLNDWSGKEDVPYRLAYEETFQNGNSKEHHFEGLIRKEPEKEELVMGGLTCQYHYGFPYRPVRESLGEMNPDILYFSGDQLYEGNGGYGIIRYPGDRAILNYLGKWYMFGWAFGELMKDRPTICIHDDHEVFQGNLWGEGGKLLTEDQWNQKIDCIAGFVEPVDMLNVVIKTNSSHLPDPPDPTPMENDILVYYTDLLYGEVSFAIVGDRVFKSGPDQVATWEGRLDHLKEPLSDHSLLDKPGLTLLGDRQMDFLEQWVGDWKGASMKVLLSQTVFTYSSTHSGPKMEYLEGDLDSGGWPKRGRDEAIRLMRKAFTYHICGDQHLPSLIQYGLEDYRDAGWVFCTPAVAVGYQRSFLPDRLGWPVNNRPVHSHPNTGNYKDGFSNLNYIYAVGNPDEINVDENRYKMADLRSSGFGIIRFNLVSRDIKAESYRFLSKTNDGSFLQFPGWPHTVNQLDNYGREPAGFLPPMEISGLADPVVEVTNEATGEIEYILRIKGQTFIPKVFSLNSHSIRIGDPDLGIWKTVKGQQPVSTEWNNQGNEIKVEF